MTAISLGASFVMLEGAGAISTPQQHGTCSSGGKRRGQQGEALLALKEIAAATAKGASAGEEWG